MDKRIIEISDWIFANPEIKRSEIVSKYSKKFQLSERRVDTLLAKARNYNIDRQISLEKKKEEVLVNSELDGLKKAIISRDEVLSILADKARGVPTKTPTGIRPVRDADQIAAAKVIIGMEGYDAAIKLAQTNSKGEDVSFVNLLMQVKDGD